MRFVYENFSCDLRGMVDVKKEDFMKTWKSIKDVRGCWAALQKAIDKEGLRTSKKD